MVVHCFHVFIAFSCLLVRLGIAYSYWLISQLAFCKLSVSILFPFSSGCLFVYI